LIRIEKITSRLETDFIGREIHYFRKLSSTNTSAKEQVKKGAKEGTTIIAETQTDGKGRLNRRWVSPKGGIWLSIILRSEVTAEDAAKITVTTALAVANTLRILYGLKAQIKWPNDVLIQNKKICGILVEATLKEKAVDSLVVGIGLNANFTLQDLSQELQRTVTTLEEVLKKKVDLEELICVILREFEEYYRRFNEKEFSDLLSEWRSMASFLGKKVEITSLNERLTGVAIAVDKNGELIIRLENGIKRKIVSGDLVVRED
jgi:BirA family biotin operon repressor/biotin-[acetyl-CoA-carboxylase] ligase